MAKVRIIEKATGEVLETGKEVGDIHDWNFYWTMQCNTELYRYEIEKEA